MARTRGFWTFLDEEEERLKRMRDIEALKVEPDLSGIDLSGLDFSQGPGITQEPGYLSGLSLLRPISWAWIFHQIISLHPT